MRLFPAGDSVPDWPHILLCFFCIEAKSVRLYIEGCRHVIIHPRGLLFILVFLQQIEMSHNFAFQCSCWISAETSRRMGTEVIFLSPLCIIMYVWFAGSKIKCYFYFEVLQRQNVEKKNRPFVILACLCGGKELWVFFITFSF